MTSSTAAARSASNTKPAALASRHKKSLVMLGDAMDEPFSDPSMRIAAGERPNPLRLD
jgi:hypothetical protein